MMTEGLKTKILTNGIQGMIFVVLFDLLKNLMNLLEKSNG